MTEEKVLIPAAYAKKYHPEQYNGTRFSNPYLWGTSSVRTILGRQEYLGHTVLRKSVSTNFKLHKRKETDEDEQYVFQNTHEPIISQELWDSVQKRRCRVNRASAWGTHTNRLSGYLYCADCGRRLTLQTHYSKKDGSTQYSYRCGGYVRLMNPMLPDDPNSKLNVCVQNVLKIWEEGKDQKLTQLLFCDLSTPKNDGNFNVYDDIRKKLVAAGVPENEIEFIHNADTEAKKAALFSKVRSGDVRVLLGSTAKMGAGTNVQSRLVAVHHLDVGWKPSDMTQRNGRIIRQGNMNKEVKVFNYVTEGTFDSYLFVRHEVA